MKNCFAECGITKQIAEDNNDELGEELTDVVKELVTQIDYDLTAEEYIDFEVRRALVTIEPAIDSDQVNWREAWRHACI